MQQFGDITVVVGDDFVAEVEIHRPPNNFVDVPLLGLLADTFDAIDDDPLCRVILLCSEGKHFCAGANIDPARDEPMPTLAAAELYEPSVRLIKARTPVVAAVQGAAVGAGLGLACSADFRVAAPEARFTANFARLGFHPGFGLSVLLPLIVGHQRALEMLYTGRRVTGAEALAMGLCDRLVPSDRLRASARELAADIAGSAPLAVRSIRQTMRGKVADAVESATVHEGEEQIRLRGTADFAEGVRASAARRTPIFVGH